MALIRYLRALLGLSVGRPPVPNSQTPKPLASSPLPDPRAEEGGIADIPPLGERDKAGAIFSTSTERILLDIPLEVQRQLDDSAPSALKNIFQDLFKPIINIAREKAARRGGLDLPLIRDSEIHEAKEVVWRREFSSKERLRVKVLNELEHASFVALGVMIELGWTESPLKDPRWFLVKLIGVVGFIYLLRVSKSHLGEAY
jgi:hypothetical protein